MELTSLTLQIAIISLITTIIIIIYNIISFILTKIYYLDFTTWKFDTFRFYVICSCFFCIITMFIINYTRLGRKVFLDNNILIIINYYIELNNIVYINTNILVLLLINILIILIVLCFFFLLSYYMKLIRISFISLHYYLEYLDVYKDYPYKFMKAVCFKYHRFNYYLKILHWLLDIYLHGFFLFFYKDEKSFRASYSNYIYKIFSYPLGSLLKNLKSYLGYIILLYYCYLFIKTGQIELYKIYYILIYLSIIRLIVNILHFLLMERYRECIPTLIIIHSTYKPLALGSDALFYGWYAQVKNLKDLEGNKLRSEAAEKYYHGEFNIDQVYEVVNKKKSIDVIIDINLNK
jgi:hypothetical protein